MASRASAVILALAVLAAGVGGIVQHHLQAPPAPAALVGQEAPALVLPDLDGATHDLRDYRGRRVLLNFWASWCLPCRQEMPALEQAQRRYGEHGALVLGVAMDEAAPVRAFLAQLPVSYPILLESPRTPGAATRFGDRDGLLPYSVLVGTDGRVLDQHLGPLDAAMLQAWLAPPAVSP